MITKLSMATQSACSGNDPFRDGDQLVQQAPFRCASDRSSADQDAVQVCSCLAAARLQMGHHARPDSHPVLHQLQALLGTWTGTCIICGSRIDIHAPGPT